MFFSFFILSGTKIPNKYNNGYYEHGFISMVTKSDKQIHILLFGGKNAAPFTKTFVELIIMFQSNSLSSIQQSNFNKYVQIGENKRSMPKISYIADKNISHQKNNPDIDENYHKTIADHLNKESISHFGFDTLINNKNETIVVIIGGYPEKRYGKSIMLYNCDKNELFVMENALPIVCKDYPSIMIHCDHIHVIQGHLHFLVNLKMLFGKFKCDECDWNKYSIRDRVDWNTLSTKSTFKISRKNVTVAILISGVILLLIVFMYYQRSSNLDPESANVVM